MRNKKTFECSSHSSLWWHSVLPFHHLHEFANWRWQACETTDRYFSGRCLPRADQRLLEVHRPLSPPKALRAQGLLGDTSPLAAPECNHLTSSMLKATCVSAIILKMHAYSADGRGCGVQDHREKRSHSSFLASSALIHPSLSQLPRLSGSNCITLP